MQVKAEKEHTCGGHVSKTTPHPVGMLIVPMRSICALGTLVLPAVRRSAK